MNFKRLKIALFFIIWWLILILYPLFLHYRGGDRNEKKLPLSPKLIYVAEKKNCLIEISASLEAVVTFQGGEIWYIQIKSADGFPTYLYPEAGKIDETKVKNELGKNIVYAFRYNKKDCLGDKHDEILGIFAYTLTGPKDVSEQFFSKKSAKRTGLKQ